MKTHIIKIGILILALILPSCARNSQLSANKKVSESWAQNLVCDFPCWNHVTPKQTAFQDVSSILLAANTKVTFLSDNGIDFQDNENISGSIDKGSTGLVNSIVLATDQTGITLADMLNMLNTPREIILFPSLDKRQCTASVLFPEKGTVLDFYFDNLSERGCKVNIGPDSEVSRIVLIGDSLDEFLLNSPFTPASRSTWNGYGIYP